MRRTLLLGLLLLVSCAHKPAPPPAPPAAASPAQRPGVVSIRVEHLPPGSGWRVTWQLPYPMQEVRLARPGNGDRKRQWILSTPGLSLVTRDGVDRVVSAAAPFASFQAVLVEFARKPEKDYQAFIPFEDGTVLVYTGMLDVAGPPTDEPWKIEFELVPRPGDAVVVNATRVPGKATWRSRGDGTYVAFGSTPTLETPLGLAVVDRGMPAWLRDRTLAFALQAVGYYTARTGWRLEARPTFFLSYGREEDPGALSFGGGTLDGVVQLDTRIGSRHATDQDPVVWERQARLVAHEAAHLWLDQLFRPADGSSRWLDEGGADAWALRAMLDLDVVNRNRFRQILREDTAECLRLLQDGPLATAARAGRWKALYRCGQLASFLTEAAGSRRAPPWDLVQFWGQVFYGTRGGVYDEALWFDILLGLPGGERAAGVVRRVVGQPDASLAADVDELLQYSQ
ncbi:MAG: hypothetical protein RJA59_10 [Pseudomonadota bacterium]